jgi:hypothetical protein
LRGAGTTATGAAHVIHYATSAACTAGSASGARFIRGTGRTHRRIRGSPSLGGACRSSCAGYIVGAVRGASTAGCCASGTRERSFAANQ